MTVKHLTNKSRLPEISELRRSAYESSQYNEMIDEKAASQLFYDELDPLDSTFHFVIEENNQFVGAVRVAVLSEKEQLGESFSKLELPSKVKFALWGRIVVHPSYRKTNAMMMLDRVSKEFIKSSKEIDFALCVIIPEREQAVKRMGFKELGEVNFNWGKEIMPVKAFMVEREKLK
jgi:predicted GNAT family N-acyltransferase